MVLAALLSVVVIAVPETPSLLQTPKVEAEQKFWLVPALHSVAVLAGMRAGLSVATRDVYNPLTSGSGQLKQSWSTAPVFRRDLPLLRSDGSSLATNVVGHSAFGSEVYLRFRQCGHSGAGAFLGAAATSTAWEYGVEGFVTQPSALDLVWTPIVGSLIGEGRYRVHRAARNAAPSFGRTLMMWVVDPFGQFERTALKTSC